MKRRNLFMSVMLMCGFLCLAFTFDNAGVHWLWTDAKPVAVILAIATVILGAFWFKSSSKLRRTSKELSSH